MEVKADNQQDLQAIEELKAGREKLLEQIQKVIVGQQEVVDLVLMAIFCRGHSLMVGVPGLAKTLLVRTIASIMDLKFKRIQFTPDLMPSDITGIEIIQEDSATGKRTMTFQPGPVFANILLADEINRTPPKTQAALLQAMEEHLITVGDKTYRLEEPFFVLATQNPIEQEGTYPLPEAQLDRFMFNIVIEYPTRDEEAEIIRRTTAGTKVQLEPIMSAAQIIRLQDIVRKIPVSDNIIKYTVAIVSGTRPGEDNPYDFIKKWVRWGAGPRASQYIILGAKARAVIRGNYFVSHEDIKAAAIPVLRHRIIPTFQAQSEGIATADIIKKLLSTIKHS